MATVQEPTAIDTDKLMSFVFRAVDEVGATLECRVGGDGRQARALQRDGRCGPDQASASWPGGPGLRSATREEWLNAQAAGGYVEPTTLPAAV